MTITGFPDIFTWAVCSIYLLGLSLIAHKTRFTRDSALWTVGCVDESPAWEPESLTDWRPDFVPPTGHILLSEERKGKGKPENSKERRGKEATINNEFKVHLHNKQLAIQKDKKRKTKYQLLKHNMWTHLTTWPCGHCPSHLFRRSLPCRERLYYSQGDSALVYQDQVKQVIFCIDSQLVVWASKDCKE